MLKKLEKLLSRRKNRPLQIIIAEIKDKVNTFESSKSKNLFLSNNINILPKNKQILPIMTQ